MRRHNAITAIPRSFFSADLYRDVARNWRGIGFWYLVLVMLLTTIFPVLEVRAGLRKFARDEYPRVAREFPEFTIKNGQVTSSEQQPYDVKDPDTGEVLFRLDTTGKTKDLTQTKAIVLLTKDRLHTRDNRGNIKSYNLKQFNVDLTVNEQNLVRWMDNVARHGPWVFGVTLFVFKLVGYLILVLIVGALGLAISNSLHAGLTYAQTLRLAAIAATPGAVVGGLLWLVPVMIPCCGGEILVLLIMLGFVWFGVKANSGEHAPPPSGFGGGPYGYGQPPFPQAYPQQGGYMPPPPPPQGYPPIPPPPGYGQPPYPPRQ
jgi:hypothetical protein